MKNSMMIAALAAMTISLAQGATLVQSWDDFSTLTEGNALLNGATVNEDGSLSVGNNSGSYTNRPTIDIADASLSLTDGLSLTLKVKGWTTGQENVILASFASSSNDFLMAAASASGTADFFFNGSSTKVTDIGTQSSLGSANAYTFITLTSELVGEQCIFTLYSNGEHVGQAYANDNTIAAQDITRLTFGGWSGNSNYSRTALTIADIGLYEGALTASEVKALYTASVPEPTTATLSLLALAGLAARRRRK